MRKRAERFAQVQHTTSQYTRPAPGKKLASTANRDGVAERFPEPAVQRSSAVDWALSTHDDPRLTALELSIVKAATHQDANPLDLWQTVPGIGTILRRVRLYDMHDLDRFPRGQAVVS